jgi:ABC-type phosphate transport system substrate-binding protein
MRDFIDLALGQGQSIAAEIGYVPLPGPAILRAQVLTEKMR